MSSWTHSQYLSWITSATKQNKTKPTCPNMYIQRNPVNCKQTLVPTHDVSLRLGNSSSEYLQNVAHFFTSSSRDIPNIDQTLNKTVEPTCQTWLMRKCTCNPTRINFRNNLGTDRSRKTPNQTSLSLSKPPFKLANPNQQLISQSALLSQHMGSEPRAPKNYSLPGCVRDPFHRLNYTMHNLQLAE